MSNTYQINEYNQVVTYTSGRKCLDARNRREATDLEIQQSAEIEELEIQIEELKQRLRNTTNK